VGIADTGGSWGKLDNAHPYQQYLSYSIADIIRRPLTAWHYAAFLIHPHHFCLFLITLCSLFSSTWHPFLPHLLHSTYIAITSFVYHPISSRHAPSEMSSPQYSCTFHRKTYTRLLLHSPCYTSHGLAACAASSPSSALLNFLSVSCADGGSKGIWSRDKSDNKW